MSDLNEKALEAARRAIEAHPAYDCGSTGDEEMAAAAIRAYLAAILDDAYGSPLTVPEIAMQEAVWMAIPDDIDLTISDLNRAVRAGYRAAIRALGE